MIIDNVDDAIVFFSNANTTVPPMRHYMGFSAALSAYFPQKSTGSILILSKNRNTVFRLTEKTDRVLKIG
jgi:hypothetical protein